MLHDVTEKTEDKSHAEQLSNEHNIPNLRDYTKNLEKNIKSRYLEKISVVGINPVMLIDVNSDPECLTLIEATDLF